MTEEELQALEAARQARKARKAEAQPQPKADISQRPDILQAKAEAEKEFAKVDRGSLLGGLKAAVSSPLQALDALATRGLDKMSLRAGDEALGSLQNLAFDLENPGVAPVGVYPRGVPVPKPVGLEDLRKERAGLSSRASNERLSALDELESQQPVAYHLGGFMGDVVGSLALPAVAARSATAALPALGEGISKGAAFLAGAKRAAPAGALAGGASTYFGGEKDPAEVAKGAALGGAFSGLLGGASRMAMQPRLDAQLARESLPLRDDLAVMAKEAKLLRATGKDIASGNKKFFKFMDDLRQMDPKEELASLREMAPPQPVSRPPSPVQSLEAMKAEKPVIPVSPEPEGPPSHWWSRKQAQQMDDDFLRAIGKEDSFDEAFNLEQAAKLAQSQTPKAQAQSTLNAAVEKIREIASRPGADKLPPDQLANYAAKEAGVPPKYARQVLFDFWESK